MKKGRKITALLLALVAAGAMTAGLAACEEEDPDSGKQEQTTEAEKIKDGGAIVFTDGRATVDLAQYVKANGNAFRATSSNPNAATVSVSGSMMTVTAAGEGTALVMVVCGEVRLTFSVSVPKTYYTVTLDGVAVPPAEGDKWQSGATYTLPEAKVPSDPNFEFKGWDVNGEKKQAGETVTVNRNLTISVIFERKAAKEVSGHALSVSLSEGKTATLNISDYITAYGREVNVSVNGSENYTASKDGDVVTLTGVASGEATLTLSVESVSVTISVNVLSANMPVFENGTINIDMFTASGGSLTFAPNEPTGHTYSYEYTLTTQDARASVTGNTLSYDLGNDYDLNEDGSTVSLIVSAAVTIDGAAAGSVSFTVTVKIKDTTPAAPVFNDVTETIDPFSSAAEENSYTLSLKAEDENFTYTYKIGGTAVSGNKVYTAEADETVNVTYVYKGNTQKSGTASFTVKITYDRSAFPVLKEESKTATIDLAEVKDGVYVLDLFSNFSNAGNIAGYTVNGTAHADGTVYTISNSGNEYGETAKEVTYIVVANIKNSLGQPLTYTYTVNVTDTTAFRMQNGGFKNGLEGWTGATGKLSSKETYFDQNLPMNNDGQYYDGTDSNTETLTSPEFTVGGSGWITFKFGSAKPVDGNNLRNVHLEFYEKTVEGDRLIADVRNILFKDPDAALKLNDYKLDLSAFKGKSVYVKAVDGENGSGDFRFINLDAFVTYWKDAPTDAKYTDLTAARYFNTSAELDLKDTNTITLTPSFLSQGLVKTVAYTPEITGSGLTADEGNPFLLTAVKSGNYTIVYKVNGEAAFTIVVTVKNTVEIPDFENQSLMIKKGESGTLSLPEPEDGSRFAYAYSVAESGASIEDGVLIFDASAKEEGTYSVRITVTVTDKQWGEGGDAFEKSFTLSVTVYGDKIIANNLLTDGKAKLSLDVYSIKSKDAVAVAAQIDVSKYLIVPEGVSVNYTATRKIGGGEASAIAITNGAYALPFADCDLTPNHVETVVFEITATNGEDPSNAVSFTLTLSIKDTTGNRIVNGDFERGNLQGWTVISGNVDLDGGTSSEIHNDWVEKLPYNKSGDYFCKNAGLGEHVKWELKSSSFVLGGNGFISFKMASQTAVLKVFKADGTQIYSYRCHTFKDEGFPHVENGGNWCTLRTHYADLHEYLGEELYVTIGNEPAELGWEFGHFDDIVTYYEKGTVMTGRQEDVLLTCTKDGVSHAEGETKKMDWILAPNEYKA